MDAFWIILTGSLVALSCALLGSFLLVRQMTMVADAISHAVLPGIVLAYLASQSRASLPMLIGAALFGVLTTILIELLSKYGRLQTDASIGISFTWMFAIGVILISLFAGRVDLDQDCVLYGEIAFVPLDTWILGNGASMGPRTVWLLAGLLVFVLLFVIISYKALIITSFDPLLAASLGISTVFWHYALMSLVSLTTVFSFEAVGAILVMAFIVGPPATGFLISRKLPVIMGIACVAGVVAAIAGYFLALATDGSIAGAMATVIGLEFLLTFLSIPLLKKFTKKPGEEPHFAG
jgi:manganese/zinc/iron transport system permease protein